MKSYSDLFTSWEGRISGFQWLMGNLVLFVAGVILGVLVGLSGGSWNKEVESVTSILFLYPTYVLIIKRLHDCNLSGWWSILVNASAHLIGIVIVALVPGDDAYSKIIAFMFWVLAFAAISGTRGSNQYGGDPICLKGETSGDLDNSSERVEP